MGANCQINLFSKTIWHCVVNESTPTFAWSTETQLMQNHSLFPTGVKSLAHQKAPFSAIRNLAFVLLATLVLPASTVAQEQAADSTPVTWRDSLQTRWVGTHLGRPLHIDFYADTMVVVKDRFVADYEATQDSIVVFGDTSFSVHYRFALGRMILRTDSGNVITMAAQGSLARPLRGNWLGTPGRMRDSLVELQMNASGTAYWRTLPAGGWIEGEWDRFSREITFTWFPDSAAGRPDSTQWVGMYNPVRSQLLFDETLPESGVTILRRFFRRPRN